MHQSDVDGDYEDMRDRLHPVITVNSSEASEPDINWWKFAGGYSLPTELYGQATQYHDLIGWSQYISDPRRFGISQLR